MFATPVHNGSQVEYHFTVRITGEYARKFQHLTESEECEVQCAALTEANRLIEKLDRQHMAQTEIPRY